MIPLLVTMDLEIAHDHKYKEQGEIIEKLCVDMNKLKIPLTAFTTSEFADYFPGHLKTVNAFKNEIGCHGLNHNKDENYKYLPYESIYNNLKSANKNIEEIICDRPISFRGPAMSTSAITQKVLIELGFKNDFSVCPQRIDFFTSKGGNVKWLSSPRLPYHPSDNNPYKKGNMPIWVIPLSSIGIPFISGILYLFGLQFMKRFFLTLMRESEKTGKPIVYIFHSYEFTEYVGHKDRNNYLKYLERNKRPFIHKLYLSDPGKRYNMNMELFKYMLTFDSIRTFTGKQYSEYLNTKTN
jgi:hypothetical protein